jgi:hypothetical protein
VLIFVGAMNLRPDLIVVILAIRLLAISTICHEMILTALVLKHPYKTIYLMSLRVYDLGFESVCVLLRVVL